MAFLRRTQKRLPIACPCTISCYIWLWYLESIVPSCPGVCNPLTWKEQKIYSSLQANRNINVEYSLNVYQYRTLLMHFVFLQLKTSNATLYLTIMAVWVRFLSLARNKLWLCSANDRPGYWSNLPCDWPSIAELTPSKRQKTSKLETQEKLEQLETDHIIPNHQTISHFPRHIWNENITFISSCCFVKAVNSMWDVCLRSCLMIWCTRESQFADAAVQKVQCCPYHCIPDIHYTQLWVASY